MEEPRPCPTISRIPSYPYLKPRSMPNCALLSACARVPRLPQLLNAKVCLKSIWPTTYLNMPVPPLHVAVIIERIQQAFGIAVDRESLVSSLTKKVARNDRFSRTEKNTFGLLPEAK